MPGKKVPFSAHKSKSTSQNFLALLEMPLFDKNIKILVKKRLEEKSCVLTPQVEIHFAKLFSTLQNAVYRQKHQNFGQKTLRRKK
jgi:uncharacterized protein YdhG (YjbR/CyaY superfamily)